MSSVLVVDDEAAMRNLMTRWVELAGHHASTAASADEALEVLARQAPAVALCDVRMPGHDGLWLAGRIRREFPDTAIIVATGARDTDPRVAEHAGAVDYLLKPFGRDRLNFALERGFDWHENAASRREWLQRLEADMQARRSQLADALSRAGIDGGLSLDTLLTVMEELEPGELEHARRVADLSLSIGRVLGLTEAQLTALQRGALLHDIGKLALPEAILRKPAALSLEEKEIVRQHPEIAVRLLRDIADLQDATAVVSAAKEWYDGSGYPQALSGEAIPLGSRIVSVAEAYDAMTHTHIYRDAIPRSDALREILRCSSTQFDPVVVSSLLEVLGESASSH